MNWLDRWLPEQGPTTWLEGTTTATSTTSLAPFGLEPQMVARAWTRIYVRNDPNAGQCVQMLLVAKFGPPGRATWVAVDNVGRLQVVDVSVRARVASRPWAGITVGGLRGLSVVEKQRALTKAQAMIAVQDVTP